MIVVLVLVLIDSGARYVTLADVVGDIEEDQVTLIVVSACVSVVLVQMVDDNVVVHVAVALIEEDVDADEVDASDVELT